MQWLDTKLVGFLKTKTRKSSSFYLLENFQMTFSNVEKNKIKWKGEFRIKRLPCLARIIRIFPVQVWDPAQAGGIRKLHIPTDQIWVWVFIICPSNFIEILQVPDIVLYNNADGEPQITIMNDALVYYNGLVVWKPPSIYKSFCSIDIEQVFFRILWKQDLEKFL